MMSTNIRKAVYVFYILAVIAVAFFGMSTVASAQSDEGYSDGYYYINNGGSDYGNSYDPYYGYGGYDQYAYHDNDCYYDCYDSGYDECDYYDCYDYDYDECYYYDCYDYDYDECYYYDCYDYDYDDCGYSCGGSNDTIIDIWNNNVNTNTNTNTNISYNDNDDEDEDDRDRDRDFSVRCIPSDDEVEEGDRVTFEARVSGVDEDDVDFDWSGDVDGDDEEVSKRFTREGTYRIRVEAEYRGDTESDTCTVEVEDEDRDNDRVTLVSTPPVGTPASLNSVYLSQVPYTGASDNAKLIGFITMLALSSLAGAYYIVTRKARADRKSFIERFKQENLSSRA